ncbi:MAG TPA: RimK family alpha-L-glutamate ligase [Polyangiaceae bacterium]
MLKIAILSHHGQSYSARRLCEAAKKRGHVARAYDTLRFSLLVDAESPGVFYDGERFEPQSAVLPRVGPSVARFGLAVIRQLESLGVLAMNSAEAIAASRDKLRAAQLLASRGVRVPATAYARHREAIRPAVERLGGAPVVVKMLEGAQGIGVILAETPEAAEAVVQALHSARQNVLIQRFVRESRGRDVRAVVVGGRVVAAMSRVAKGTEFRSNVHRGARGEEIALEPKLERAALDAARILGLDVAGVDLLESSEGPLVLEVNASPGLEGIESATGVDVANAVIEHLEKRVAGTEPWAERGDRPHALA